MIKNKVAELLKARSHTPYRFWKMIGTAQQTAYNLANNPLQIPSAEVLDSICEAYGVEVADVIEHIPNEQGEEPLKKIAA